MNRTRRHPQAASAKLRQHSFALLFSPRYLPETPVPKPAGTPTPWFNRPPPIGSTPGTPAIKLSKQPHGRFTLAMNTLALLTQIQNVAAASTAVCFILYLFRKRRAFRIKAVHPILFGSQLSIAVFCACLALRAELAPEFNLLSFWLGASGASVAVLCILLSYRFLWKLCVDVSRSVVKKQNGPPQNAAPV
jgi:hypothetical protein